MARPRTPPAPATPEQAAESTRAQIAQADATQARLATTREALSIAERTRDHLDILCRKHNYDPFEALILMAQDPTVEDKIKFQAHQELASYKGARIKPVEIQNAGGKMNGISIVIQNFGTAKSDPATPVRIVDVTPIRSETTSDMPTVLLPPMRARA